MMIEINISIWKNEYIKCSSNLRVRTEDKSKPNYCIHIRKFDKFAGHNV